MNKQQWISSKITNLIGEGRSQQQAIAMAYSMWEQRDKKQEGGYKKEGDLNIGDKDVLSINKSAGIEFTPEFAKTYFSMQSEPQQVNTPPKDYSQYPIVDITSDGQFTDRKVWRTQRPEWFVGKQEAIEGKDYTRVPYKQWGAYQSSPEHLSYMSQKHPENSKLTEMKFGGYQELPMAQEAIMKHPKRLDGSNNMYANDNSYNGFGQTINPVQGMGNAPFNSQAFGIPMATPFDSTQKGFYPAQGNTFPNSVSYGQAANPNYGSPVTAMATPNTNMSPFAKANVDPMWAKPALPSKKGSKPAAPVTQKTPMPAATTAAAPTARAPITPLIEYTPAGMTTKTPAEELQESAKKGLEPLNSQYTSDTEETKPEMDWIKYNILNPYGQGMDLGTSLAYTGQQFGKGNTGMGIAGAGLSALKGVRSFLSGYGSGKGELNVEQEMRDKLHNSDEQLYRGKRGVFKEGGEITNADLLTGNYITEEGQQDPNIEIEEGEHTKNSQTGEVQEAAGKKHSEGGISVNLPDQSKVLSDYTKIGSTNVKAFEDMFDVKLKASDTFATVLDKYNKKIGINKLEEEEKELVTKVEKNSNSPIEKKTKQINEDFLAQELAELSKKKEALNKVKSEAFEAIFKEQEKIPKKGDGTQVLDESGKPMAQEGGVMDENIIALAEQYGTTPEQILQILQENNMKQEGGEQQAQGQPDPQQIIQAYAQMAGQDPNQVMRQIQQMPPEEQQAALQQMMAALQQGQQSGQEEQAEGQMSAPAEEVQEQPQMQDGGYSGLPIHQEGKYTKEEQAARLHDFYVNATTAGYEGAEDIGSIQKFMAKKHPEAVLDYFTKNGQPLTAKHMDMLKKQAPEVFDNVGLRRDKDSAQYTKEEKDKIFKELGTFSKTAEGNAYGVDNNFLLNGFQDNKWDWRAPMVGIYRAPAIGMNKPGISAPGISAPTMAKYFSPQDNPVVEDTPAGVVNPEKPSSKNPVRDIISTEGLPYVMSPSAAIAPYLQQVNLSRLEGQKGSVENQLAASENARQAAYQATKGLPPAQAAAMMANYLATSGQQDTAGIAQQEQQDLGNKARIEQYNAGQSDKEQILNEQLKKQYEREAFGTLNVNEQNWRNYYDANQANQKALSDKIDRRNIMNLGLTNYQLNGSGGFDFVNNSPFESNVSSPTPEEQKITDEALKKKKAYASSTKKSS